MNNNHDRNIVVFLCFKRSLQEVNYSYNVGGVTDSNEASNTGPDKLFNFNIGYTNPQNGATPLYNGNISETQWRTANTDSALKSYNYAYGPLNRITRAIDDTNDNRYSLTNVEYDKNGNIQKLKRNGHLVDMPTQASHFGVMDDMAYSYTGNQLKAVDDDIASSATQGFVDGAELATEYTYDANGNMISDANKGITGIIYNHLNLPEQVTINGNGNNGNIQYVYAADGTKLKKTLSTAGVETLYASGYIYEGNMLQFFPHAEGYVSVENGNYEYVYNYVDHLGNVRLSYTDANGDGDITTNEIIKESNYYPFGLSHKGYNEVVSPLGNSVAKKYMFGGKEYQDELDLSWYDVTARNYDPALGRWMNLDQLAEVQEDFTPYHYAYNSPITFSDPTGTIPIYGPNNFATKVINEDDPTQTYIINDGYDFDFYVSGDDFQTIVNNSNGSILPSSKLPASTVARWVSEATAFEIRKFKSENPLGGIFAWFGFDEAEAIIEQGTKGNVTQLAIQIGTGKLKKLKKFARWLKKNKGKKLPGTTQGGGQFKNREGKLPKQDANGKDIIYQKYDVEPPTQDVRPRGTKRMVIGGGKVYYTDDHYSTFTEILPDGK